MTSLTRTSASCLITSRFKISRKKFYLLRHFFLFFLNHCMPLAEENFTHKENFLPPVIFFYFTRFLWQKKHSEFCVICKLLHVKTQTFMCSTSKSYTPDKGTEQSLGYCSPKTAAVTFSSPPRSFVGLGMWHRLCLATESAPRRRSRGCWRAWRPCCTSCWSSEFGCVRSAARAACSCSPVRSSRFGHFSVYCSARKAFSSQSKNQTGSSTLRAWTTKWDCLVTGSYCCK